MCECVCEWVNERHTLYSALDKGAIYMQSIFVGDIGDNEKAV